MRTYLKTIQITQKIVLGISIFLLLALPLIIVFTPDLLSDNGVLFMYDLSHIFVFLVMIVRPLADIFTRTKLIRPLVILRKSFGVFSASLIVSFILSKIIINPTAYFSSFLTLKYWSLAHYSLLAHIADISAIILLITSNNFSKRILGSWWKKIQKLSYPYFYASALYVFLISGHVSMLISMFIITALTMLAYVKNQAKINQQTI